jgi:hypothetical protein
VPGRRWLRNQDAMALKRFQKDNRVSHARFGPGVIIDTNERYTIIAFDHAGLRKFVTAIVELERSDLPRPVTATAKRRRGMAHGLSTVAEAGSGSAAIRRKRRPNAPQDLPKPEEPA